MIPNGFRPSRVAHQYDFGTEGRLMTAADVNQQITDIGSANLNYQTDAETSVAPFLAQNIANDSRRRNYVIESGGRVRFTSEPVGPKRVLLPDERIGHNSDEFIMGRSVLL